MRRLTLLFLLVAACDAAEDTAVRIDLSGLWQEAAQVDFTLAELTVTGAGMSPIVQSLDPADMSFELDVPSGSARTFAVEGYNANTDGPEHLTQYWGFDRVDLPRGGTVDVSIPIARAGRLPGRVSLSDERPIPASVEIIFDYYSDPIPELPGPLSVTATNGVFSVPLPLGSVEDPFREYVVTVGPVSVMGVSYGLLEPEIGYVSQHGLNQPPLYLVLEPTSCVVGGTIECCSDGDCDGGICNLDTNICEACVVGDAIQCCFTSDCSPGFTCNTATHVCEGGPTVSVMVIDHTGAAYVDGADVLVHDGSGVLQRQAVTDASGQAIVQVASGDMVSVLYVETPDVYDNHYVLSVASVEPGDTIRYQLPGYTPLVQEGTLTVNPDGSPPGGIDTQFATYSGGYTGQVTALAPLSRTMYSNNLGDDDNLDVLAWGYDVKMNLVGFSKLPDLARGNWTVTLSSWDLATPLELPVNFSNVVTKRQPELRPVRDGRVLPLDQTVDEFMGGIYKLPIGFFDHVNVDVLSDSWPFVRSISRRYVNDTYSPFDVNFATDFLPLIEDSPNPPEVSVGVARPVVTWSTTATSGQFDVTSVNVILNDMNTLRWSLVAPSTQGSPVTMPDLSAAPVGYQPELYLYLQQITVDIIETDIYDYRQFVNNMGHTNQDVWPQQQLTVKRSGHMGID